MFLATIVAHGQKHREKKAVDLNLGCAKIPSTNFIKFLSLNLPSFLKDHYRKLVVNKLPSQTTGTKRFNGYKGGDKYFRFDRHVCLALFGKDY